MASNMLPELPYLPAHLVLEKIVPYLPTKSSIRVSSLSKHCWDQGLFFSKPVLNFDEYDDIESVNEHKKFINFLEGYLKFCLEKEDEQVVLNRLRLHTTSFEWNDDYNIITKWLERAIQRGVKELDICLGICTDELIFGDEFKKGNIYCAPWPGTFANAKYLTRLSLGHLSIRKIRGPGYLLPSLKTLCLRHVWLLQESLPSVLSHCPYLEYFSLTSCNFTNTELHIQSCPSLKSLELKYCGWLYFLTVDKVENLQSFKFVSLPPPRPKTCVELHLNVSSNMKNIYIDCVDGFETLHIRGCHELEATIISQSLKNLYFQGYMTAKVSIEACPKALISLDADQFWIDQRFLPDDSPHFSSVIRFLLNFGCCEKIFLDVPCDFKALIFPEAYRNILPAPLPKCSSLKVMMPNPPTKESGDYFDLMDSLHWIAPSASEAICLLQYSNALEEWRLLQL